MDDFPKSYLYVPAEHDEFVQIAYNNKMITESQILSVDCEIIDRSNLVIAYGTYHSNGMKVEIEHSTQTDTPIYYMPNMSEDCINGLKASMLIIMGFNGE